MSVVTVGGLTQPASEVGELLGNVEGLGVRPSAAGAVGAGLGTPLGTMLDTAPDAPDPQAAVAAAISVTNTIRI